MNADQLFLGTIHDLERRVHPAPSEYEVLGLAALLRKLLLDSHCLVDQVNRERRLKLRYTVTDSKPLWELAGGPKPIYWSMQDGLDPETALRPRPTITLTKDQLLARVIMVSGPHEITVKDVILHGANVAGAVHRGTPRGEPQEEMARTAQAFNIGGYASGIRDLQAVGRVVLKALAPLRDAVQSDCEQRCNRNTSDNDS